MEKRLIARRIACSRTSAMRVQCGIAVGGKREVRGVPSFGLLDSLGKMIQRFRGIALDASYTTCYASNFVIAAATAVVAASAAAVAVATAADDVKRVFQLTLR